MFVLQDALLPVPAALLEGSLLLGSLTHIVLGDTATSSTISLHPVMIAGWCGLVTTALNCLPVGSLDGGRVMLVAFHLMLHTLSKHISSRLARNPASHT